MYRWMWFCYLLRLLSLSIITILFPFFPSSILPLSLPSLIFPVFSPLSISPFIAMDATVPYPSSMYMDSIHACIGRRIEIRTLVIVSVFGYGKWSWVSIYVWEEAGRVFECMV